MKNKVAYNSLVNLLGVFFVTIATVISTPYLIKTLGQDGFSIFRLILVSVISVTYLIDLGLSGVVRRVLGSAINKNEIDKAKKLLYTINFLYLIFGTVAAVVIIFIGFYLKSKIDIPLNYRDQYDYLVLFSSLYIFLLFFQSVCNSILMIFDKFLKYQIVVSGAKIFQVAALIVLLPFVEDKIIYSGFITIIVFLLFFLLSIYFVGQEWSDFKYRFSFNRVEIKDIKNLIGHNFIVSLCPVVIFYMNDFVVAANLSIALLGIYTIAMLFTNQMKTIISSMLSPLFTLVNKVESKNESGIESIFQQTFFISLLIWSLLVFPLFYSMEGIIKIWVGESFNESVEIIKINLISTIGLVFYLIVYNFLNATGQIKKISSLSLATVIIYFLLLIFGYILKIYSLMYFSVIFSFILIFRGLGSIFIINKTLNVFDRYYIIKLCKLMFFIFLVMGISYLSRQTIQGNNLFSLICYFSIVYLSIILLVFLLLSNKQKKLLFSNLKS